MIRDVLPSSTTSERRYIIASLQNMLSETRGGAAQGGISFQDLQACPGSHPAPLRPLNGGGGALRITLLRMLAQVLSWDVHVLGSCPMIPAVG